MERTIKVTGTAKMAIKPDTIRLIIAMEGLKADYAEAVKESADTIEELKSMFEKLGFAKSELKTIYFNMDTQYESLPLTGKGWIERLKGYRYHHKAKIEFAADSELVGKVLFALGNSSLKPKFDIEYTVANPEEKRDELREQAVKDSMKKASLLAAAAGVALGEIKNIDYSWEELDFISNPFDTFMCTDYIGDAEAPLGGSYDMNIDPDDITVTDNVTVIWTIK